MATATRLPQSRPAFRQDGATLVIALIFLIVLTLLVFSGVTTGVLSYRIAANMQQQREAVAAAQAAIDGRLGTTACLSSPSTCGGTETIGAYTVTVATPSCIAIDSQQPTKLKSQYKVTPIPTYLWELTATASNSATGISATVTQGIKMQMAIGTNCPN